MKTTFELLPDIHGDSRNLINYDGTAKLIISKIIGQEIQSLEFKTTESTTQLQKESLTI